MAKARQRAAKQSGTSGALHARVEEAAMHLVLGDPGGADPILILEGIGAEAEAAGRADVARMAAEALDEMAKMPDAGARQARLSGGLVRIQQVLAGAPAAAVSPQAAGGGEASPAAESSAPPAAAIPLGEDPELLGDFILESRDHLAQVEVQMIRLEKEPEDGETINAVFRAFHTLKGLAGFLDLGDICEVAHETEALLDLARNRQQVITPAVVDLVLASADFLRIWLGRLEALRSGTEAGPAPEKLVLLKRIRSQVRGGRSSVGVAAAADLPVADASAEFGERRKAPAEGWEGPERRSGADRRNEGADRLSVKVDTAKLDYLVDTAGEMVIAQAMLRHNPEFAGLRSPALLHNLAQLARITGDLQKTAMAMRMVPIGGLFQRMNRLVRDLARKTGKQAEMETQGAETELDRNVVEELADPLMHMVRNAMDHGLESPEERRAAGKDPIGRVRLRAFHQAGSIVIEIADDGRGLDREKILEKARRTGVVGASAALPDDEVFNLIFHPGFSTADKVTDVSGRGVGMDVVKRQIQKLRGRVGIESVPGKGTTFFLRLPLTLAMIEGLVVGIGAERYVVPIFSVREILRPSAEMVFTVEGRQEMALVRDNLLPVVRLSKRFGVRPRSDAAADSLLIVAEAAGKSFCLMVDELMGKQEVVIKSLGETLKDIPGVAGGAILGDGRVGLILDLEGLFHGGIRKGMQ